MRMVEREVTVQSQPVLKGTLCIPEARIDKSPAVVII